MWITVPGLRNAAERCQGLTTHDWPWSFETVAPGFHMIGAGSVYLVARPEQACRGRQSPRPRLRKRPTASAVSQSI